MIELQTDESLVSFKDFIVQVKYASFEGFSSTAVANSGAFEEVRSHIQHMYGGVTAAENITSFWVESQHVSQPTAFRFGIATITEPPAPHLAASRTEPQVFLITEQIHF